MDDTRDYDAWIRDEKRQRLDRMATALLNDLCRQGELTPEARREAVARIDRWLEESRALKAEVVRA